MLKPGDLSFHNLKLIFEELILGLKLLQLQAMLVLRVKEMLQLGLLAKGQTLRFINQPTQNFDRMSLLQIADLEFWPR